MKTLSLVGSAVLLALGLAAPGRAQETFSVQALAPLQGMTVRAATAPRPTWLEKIIDVNVKNERPADAVKRIVKQAGKTLENVELDEGLADVRLSLSVRGVKVGDALAAVGRIGGAIASVSERDEKVTVYLKKRTDRIASLSELPSVGNLFTTGEAAAGFPRETRVQVERALADANRRIELARPQLERLALPSASLFSLGAKLPDKRVSVDLKKVEVREALKKVLGDAGVAYALADDLPAEAKHSFTFENVPLGTALDLICQSVGVGWTVEKTDEKGGLLVKVGKKYDRRPFLGTAPTRIGEREG